MDGSGMGEQKGFPRRMGSDVQMGSVSGSGVLGVGVREGKM